LLCLAAACAPPPPTATPTPRPTDTPVATPTGAALVEIEGLVMQQDGKLVIGVDWTSRSRISYVVQGGAAEILRPFLGETVRATGEVVDHSPWLKDIVVCSAVEADSPGRLSMRTGYIKELGVSIYMQGTHVLTDAEGARICLLSGRASGVDLDAAMLKGKVTVIGTLSPTVEGDALFMEVKLVEPIP
jgi:hypothetical protein